MSLGLRAFIHRHLGSSALTGLVVAGVAVALAAAVLASPQADAHDGDDDAEATATEEPDAGSTTSDAVETPDTGSTAEVDGTDRLNDPQGLANQFQLSENIACPAMTDSIRRLFLASYNREPTGSEFLDLATKYRTAELSLEVIGQQLAESDEFQNRYGTLDDADYIDRLYRNVRSRQSDADRQFWINSLGTGRSRGAVMLAFTESAEYVRWTGTQTPLSGYLRWYPEGTHWYCGVGSRDDLNIKPLADPTVYADYAFFNGGTTGTTVALDTVLGTTSHLAVTSGSLPPGFTSYKWGGLFDGDGDYGTALDITVSQSTSWIIVFYPSSIGEQRLGWQIEL